MSDRRIVYHWNLVILSSHSMMIFFDFSFCFKLSNQLQFKLFLLNFMKLWQETTFCHWESTFETMMIFFGIHKITLFDIFHKHQSYQSRSLKNNYEENSSKLCKEKGRKWWYRDLPSAQSGSQSRSVRVSYKCFFVNLKIV